MPRQHVPCESDPEKWFGYQRDGGQMSTRAIGEAARICADCPVKRQCAMVAVQSHAAWGIWAGVLLPGSQFRNHKRLAAAWETLQHIAGVA